MSIDDYSNYKKFEVAKDLDKFVTFVDHLNQFKLDYEIVFRYGGYYETDKQFVVYWKK